MVETGKSVRSHPLTAPGHLHVDYLLERPLGQQSPCGRSYLLEEAAFGQREHELVQLLLQLALLLLQPLLILQELTLLHLQLAQLLLAGLELLLQFCQSGQQRITL